MARVNHHRASHLRWMETSGEEEEMARVNRHRASRHRMKTTRAVRVKLILTRKRINKTAIKRQEIHPERRSNEKKICPNTGI